jgi:hypothetical protein
MRKSFRLLSNTRTELWDGNFRVQAAAACPGRVYRLMLPRGSTEVRLEAPAWRPAEAGIDREGELGVYVSAIVAESDGRALPLVGDRMPFDPVPMPVGKLRQRLGDPRIAVWDLWWAYLPLLPLPNWALWLIGVAWGGMAVSCLAAGGALLRQRFPHERRPPAA